MLVIARVWNSCWQECHRYRILILFMFINIVIVVWSCRRLKFISIQIETVPEWIPYIDPRSDWQVSYAIVAQNRSAEQRFLCPTRIRNGRTTRETAPTTQAPEEPYPVSEPPRTPELEAASPIRANGRMAHPLASVGPPLEASTTSPTPSNFDHRFRANLQVQDFACYFTAFYAGKILYL